MIRYANFSKKFLLGHSALHWTPQNETLRSLREQMERFAARVEPPLSDAIAWGRARAKSASDAIAALPAARAFSAWAEQSAAWVDARYEPKRAERVAAIGSALLHATVLTAIILSYLLARSAGGSDALSFVSADLVALDTASNNDAAGREQAQRLASAMSANETVPAPSLAAAVSALDRLALPSLADASAVAETKSVAADAKAPAQPRPELQGNGTPGPVVVGEAGLPGNAGAEAGQSSEDQLLNQMARCWARPRLSDNPAIPAVTVEVFLSPDGSVSRPPQLSEATQAAATTDARVEDAANAALRAIYVCAPYHLDRAISPSGKDFAVTFDTMRRSQQTP
jgi:hypothetical protein